MSTPVVTDKWTGNFDCNGPCRRKRLMANEFSKKAIQNYHRRQQQQNNERFILRCKQCVAAAEQAERDASAEQSRRRKQQQQQQQVEAPATAGEKEETRKCAGKCSKILIQSEFNRNQWAKGNGKSRCRTCVEESIRDETIQQSQAKETKLKAARDKVQSIRSSSTTPPQAILAAESELAALEAEQVTGLKPIKMSRGGGRGRGGRGRGIRAGGRGARGRR
eukprot:scaffold22716_cov82-Cylindrotheca_fusiformis.AAC.4